MVGVSKWTKRPVECAECSAPIMRKVIHPRTGEPIKFFFCNHACKGAWQRRAKPVDEEWLRQRYIAEKLDCVQIGKLVNRDPKSVRNWLKDFGIPTRPRGAESGHRWKRGEPSAFKGRIGLRGARSPAWQGGISPERQSFYASNVWKAAVALTYKRTDRCCEMCGISQKEAAKLGWKMHVHHIVGFRVKELRCALGNLALLCKPCHLFVHSKKNVNKDFLATVREIAA